MPACPPSGTHRYVFAIYALGEISFKWLIKRNPEEIIKGNLIEKAEIIGVYSRK